MNLFRTQKNRYLLAFIALAIFFSRSLYVGQYRQSLYALPSLTHDGVQINVSTDECGVVYSRRPWLNRARLWFNVTNEKETRYRGALCIIHSTSTWRLCSCQPCVFVFDKCLMLTTSVFCCRCIGLGLCSFL